MRDRQHTFDPIDEVAANRGQMVADIMTVTRAWIQAGRPMPPRYKTMQSFEDYDLIRGPLLWLGEADPMATQNELYETDEDMEDRAKLLQALLLRFGDRAFMSRDILEIIDDPSDADGAFTTAMCGLGSNARTIGQSLHEHMDLPAGDLILEQVGKRDSVTQWRVFQNEVCTDEEE